MAADSDAKRFTRADVAKHNTPQDCWIIVDDEVLDVTKFAKFHPGGAAFIHKLAGQDATGPFGLYHNPGHRRKYFGKFRVGRLVPAEAPEERPLPHAEKAFGDMVPYGDPAWYQRLADTAPAYYTDSHRAFRAKVRSFVETEVIATMDEWMGKDRPPDAVMKKLGAAGLLACMHGPPYPAKFTPVPPPENFDYFHELILFDEFARCGQPGVIGALTNGCSIAMSAIMRFGSAAMQAKVAPAVFAGDEHVCLAISEPNAGSDVAGMVTEAVADPAGGGGYVVNGVKKWITNGTYADWFVTAVKTTPKGGHGGLSLMLLHKSMPGLSVRKVAIRDSDISGTAYIVFENVKVPRENLIGKENNGFRMIMWNFNHERLYITTVCARFARICLEESLAYATKRRTFGKPLSEHAVIRMKIASMIRGCEMLQAWLEALVFQMTQMSHTDANAKLGDMICLIKAQASKTFEHNARETTHIFGGNALHESGVGRKVERMVAAVKGYAIPAGAEDIMDDFGARAAFKLAKATAKL